MEGFIVLNRKIKDWKWWNNLTGRGIWIYILMEANWEDQYDYHGNLIERGSFIRSLRTIAADNQVNVKTARAWLKRFQDSGEITVKIVSGYTKIIVNNYRKYQDYTPSEEAKNDGTVDGTADGTHDGTVDGTHGGTPAGTDITRTTRKTRKTNIYSHFVPPTVEEVNAYCHERNNGIDASEFVDFYTANGWTQGKGKPIKDWKACVRTWERNPFRKTTQRVAVPDYIEKQMQGFYDKDEDEHLW